MKKILLLAVCVICSMATYSQEKIFWDINSLYDGWSDNCFNRLYPTAKTLVVVDGVSVKSEIGFDYRYLVNPDTTDTPVKYPMWVHGVGKANDEQDASDLPYEKNGSCRGNRAGLLLG